jgi:TonB-linked SusC/RagA family outer membrane protein
MLTLFGIFGFQSVFAQTTVTGTVKSADDGGSLPGVSVVIEGTSLGTTTDMNGNYTLSVPAGSKSIVFSFIGMEKQTIAFTGQTTINVTLTSTAQALDEYIVVAFGTAKKGAFTGSATQINAEKLELRPITNVSSAIEGASAGIQVTSGNGQPGGGQDIRIRGFGSVNASSAPLYVIDGVPFAGYISDINMTDVESVTVLKDAASTALYGNKAANGVVMITTKKGKKGKGEMSVNISQGFTTRSISEYDRVDPMDYYVLNWEAIRNQRVYTAVPDPAANQYATDNLITRLGYNITNIPNNQVVGTDGLINPSASILPGYSDLDWQKELMRTGSRKNYDVSYQGGNETTDYYVSMSYLDEIGYTIMSDYERFSGRINVNTQPKDWFKTGLNISGTSTSAEQAYQASSTAYVNPFFFTRRMGPIYPVYLHNPATGEFILDAYGEKIYDLGNMADLGGATRPSGASPGRMVIAETLWNRDTDKATNLSAKTYLDIYFLKDFKFTVNASLDKRNYYNINFDNKIVGDGAPAGRGGRTSSIRSTINFNQLLNYNKTFGEHTVAALIGHENYDYEYNYFTGFRQGLIVDGNTELINFTTTNDISSYTDTYRTEGYLARLEYDYMQKYYVSGSFRRDGSSRFYTDNRWGNFWSASGAWRLDQENFIKQFSMINLLKLRTSYGQVGNDALNSYYPYQALYSLGYNNGLEPGIWQTSLPALDLVWESNNSFDVALEFGLFNKLMGSLEFYHKISDNLLFAVPLPTSTGSDNINKNIGTMFNRGFEISLEYDVIKTENLKWNIATNLTTVHNEFTKLPQEEIISGSKKFMVGQSRYDYWLTDWYGVDPTDGAALYYANLTTATTGIRIIGSDTLTTASNNAKYHYAGTAIPDFFGSVTNTVTYKQFELNFMFTYQVGGDILDYNYAGIMSAGNYGAAIHTDMLNRWQNPGDVTDVPRMDAGQIANFDATSDRWLIDGSFLALRQLQLSYNLPSQLAANWGVKRARAYVSGENLMMLNARKGMDVQQNFDGTTSNAYTPSRVLTFGLNVTL